MIIKFRDRYEHIAKNNQLDEDLIRSVADTIFNHSKERLENFNELTYNIKGIGYWCLREKKFLEFEKNVWLCINRGWVNVRKIYLTDNKLSWLEMMKNKILQYKYERDLIQKEKIKLIKEYAEQNAKLTEE